MFGKISHVIRIIKIQHVFVDEVYVISIPPYRNK